MKKYLIGLNKQQRKIAKFRNGLVVVIAAAGSGKTRVIERRAADLMHHGIEPSTILLMTFTRKASEELLSRVNNFCVGAGNIEAGTIHRFAYQQLKHHSLLAGLSSDFSIASSEKSLAVMTKIVSEYAEENDTEIISPLRILRLLSYSRNSQSSFKQSIAELGAEGEISTKLLDQFSGRYESNKKKMNILDFDDLLHFAVKLFSTHKHIRNGLRHQYQHIMIDEFQDISWIQAEFIKLLYQGPNESNSRSLMLVGDPGQSIFGFNGALEKNWEQFLNRRDCVRFELNVNYRSTKGIIALANIVDTQIAKGRLPMKGTSTTINNGKPILAAFTSSKHEAKEICDKIAKLYSAGTCISRQAVLCRAVSDLRWLELELTRRVLYYKVVGGGRSSNLKYVDDLMSVFEVTTNHRDKISLERLLKLLPDLQEKSAKRIIKKLTQSLLGKQWLVKLKEELENCVPQATVLIKSLEVAARPQLSLATRILKVSKLLQPLLAQHINNATDLHAQINNFELIAKWSRSFHNTQEFVDSYSIEPPQLRSENSRPALTLSTIHSAKGLEWDVVFIPALLEGKLPSHHAHTEKAMKEERRLLYVGITRARQLLFLSRPVDNTGYGRKKVLKDSEFIHLPKFLKTVRMLA